MARGAINRGGQGDAAGTARTFAVAVSALASLVASLPCAAQPAEADTGRAGELAATVAEVTAVERGFARTMADRDLQAFAGFVAEDAVFRDGAGLLVGKPAVVAAWAALFKPQGAPFSWEPDVVTVSDSGTVALSSGPVRDASGRMISRFTSVWRRETAADGRAHWRIIVDQGVPLSECK
jgi:ketosteroid isomerase-like protein